MYDGRYIQWTPLALRPPNWGVGGDADVNFLVAIPNSPMGLRSGDTICHISDIFLNKVISYFWEDDHLIP